MFTTGEVLDSSPVGSGAWRSGPVITAVSRDQIAHWLLQLEKALLPAGMVEGQGSQRVIDENRLPSTQAIAGVHGILQAANSLSERPAAGISLDNPYLRRGKVWSAT